MFKRYQEMRTTRKLNRLMTLMASPEVYNEYIKLREEI